MIVFYNAVYIRRLVFELHWAAHDSRQKHEDMINNTATSTDFKTKT